MSDAIDNRIYREPSDAAQTAPTGIPDNVLRALDRMCTPLHESRLSGFTAEADAHSMKVIRDYVLAASEARDVPEGCTPADARMLRAANHGLADENAALREALQFYADGSHFVRVNEEAWDTCSGEPNNFWFDEAETAQIEDGSLAKVALDKHSGDFGGKVVGAEISDTMIREFFDSFSSSRSLVSVLYWENALQFARALLATRASEAAPDEWQRAVGGGHLLHAEAAPSSHDTYSKVVKALERAFIALGRAGGNTVESPYRAAWIDARDAIEAAAMTSTHGMEAAFTSEALSRRDELEMPGGTQYLDRFIGAMGLLCRSKPPREMCEQWLKHESEELQSFAASNARIYWMQGIGAIEAAQVLADNPEEGEGHEGYTDDYSRSAEAAPVAVWDAKPRNNVALADLLIREICETDPADPNADDTVCIGIDDLRLIIETCAIEAENIGVAGKEAVTLSDEELTLFAETDEQFGDCNETSTDYETLMRWANLGLLECEHFTVTDAGRALLAQRDASKAEGKS